MLSPAQGDFVKNLQLLARKQPGRGLRRRPFVVAFARRFGDFRASERGAKQNPGDAFERDIEVGGRLRQIVRDLVQRGDIVGGHRREDFRQRRDSGVADHRARADGGEIAAAIGDGLLQNRQRVAQTAAREAGDFDRRFGLEFDFFGFQNGGDARGDGVGGDRRQRKTKATRQHGHGDFLALGRGQREVQMRRRLFEGFEHRAERAFACAAAEHVNFVDNQDFGAPQKRRVSGGFQNLAHFVDLRVRGGVHFDDIGKLFGDNRAAKIAFEAGLGRRAGFRVRIALFAIERGRENPRQRGFADAARAGEQIRVVRLVFGERVLQGGGDGVLADQIGEKTRSPAAGESGLAHRAATGDGGEKKTGAFCGIEKEGGEP